MTSAQGPAAASRVGGEGLALRIRTTGHASVSTGPSLPRSSTSAFAAASAWGQRPKAVEPRVLQCHTLQLL